MEQQTSRKYLKAGITFVLLGTAVTVAYVYIRRKRSQQSKKWDLHRKTLSNNLSGVPDNYFSNESQEEIIIDFEEEIASESMSELPSEESKELNLRIETPESLSPIIRSNGILSDRIRRIQDLDEEIIVPIRTRFKSLVEPIDCSEDVAELSEDVLEISREKIRFNGKLEEEPDYSEISIDLNLDLNEFSGKKCEESFEFKLKIDSKVKDKQFKENYTRKESLINSEKTAKENQASLFRKIVLFVIVFSILFGMIFFFKAIRPQVTINKGMSKLF